MVENVNKNTRDLVASAPNQNRDKFDNRLERLTPLLAAYALNEIRASMGYTAVKIDMWNCFGSHMDREYSLQSQLDSIGREEYSTKLLSEKYKFLENLGIDLSNTIVVRDDDTSTTEWTLSKIQDLLDQGIIYEDTDSVISCTNCDNIVASAESNASVCGYCQSDSLKIDKRKTLFIDTINLNIEEIRGKVVSPRKTRFLKGQLSTIPSRVMITRKRDYGQPIGISGYEDFVLDPKIGLSLMPEMVIERYDLDSITQIQGAATAQNTIPYTTILSPDISARCVLTSNLPCNIDKARLDDLGTDFFAKYLPLFMLDRARNIDEVQLENVRKEHSKTKRKIDNAIDYIKSSSSLNSEEFLVDTSNLVRALGRIANYSVREGIMDIRKFIYGEISGNIIPKIKSGLGRPADDNLEEIVYLLRGVL